MGSLAVNASGEPAGTQDAAIAVSVRGISKAFPGTRALDRVDMDLRQAEIHALCGGNGSGKSTLVKILCGVYQADEGTIRIGDREIEAAQMHPDLARELGVRVVHQDLAVFPDLSVAENLALGATFPVSQIGNVRWRELSRQSKQLIERFEIAARPQDLLRDLPIAKRAQVAIARALQDVASGEGLLILDEPTAALPAHEVELLLTAIRRLAEVGHPILFVSHRLDEVLAATKRVTVLRDGSVFSEHRTAELTESELIEAIIGRTGQATGQAARRSRTLPPGAVPLLQVADLRAGPVRGIDLEVMPGEVVGVAGLLGSGRTELLRAIYGDLKILSGTVRINGKPTAFAHSEEAIAAGVVMVPEDRAVAGAFADLTVDENLDVSVLRRYWRWTGFRRSQLHADDDALRSQFRVRAPSGGIAMKALSGGNQQKAILARWLRRDPVLLLLDEPTQGVDVGARADIYAAVRQLTAAGGAALLVLSDFEELAQTADRAVVMRSGAIVAHVSGAELSAARLTELSYTDREPIKS